MLKLEEKTRNEIVQTLQMQVVPAGSGAILMQIAQILSGLKSEDAPTTTGPYTIHKPEQLVDHKAEPKTPTADHHKKDA